MQARVVERHCVAFHQVLDRDLADARRGPLAAHVQRRHRHHGHARAVADLDHAAADLVGQGGHGDDRVAQLQALREARQLLERPEHAHPVQQASELLLVVVEESHRAPLVAARQLLHQADAGIARAHDDHLRSLLAAAAVQGPLLEGAIGHPAQRHEGHEEQRVEDVLPIAEARVGAERVQRERRDHGAAQHREHDALDVGQAGIAPDPLVDAEEYVDRDLDRRGDREGRGEIAQLGFAEAVDLQQQERKHEREAERQRVVQRGEERARVGLEGFHRGGNAAVQESHGSVSTSCPVNGADGLSGPGRRGSDSRRPLRARPRKGAARTSPPKREVYRIWLALRPRARRARSQRTPP